MQPTLIPHYHQAPGHCFTCKASQRDVAGGREKIIDLGVELESPVQDDPSSPQFHVQYLTEPLVVCETCVVELGQMVGMATPGRASELETEAARWRAMADQEAAKVADLTAAVDGLRRAGYAAVQAVQGLIDDVGESPACPECGRGYKTEASVARHMRLAHQEAAGAGR